MSEPFCLAALCIKPFSSDALFASETHFKTVCFQWPHLPFLWGHCLKTVSVSIWYVCARLPPQKCWLREIFSLLFLDIGVEIMWKRQSWYNLPKVNSLKRQMSLPDCTVPAPRALRYQSVVLFLPAFWLRSCHWWTFKVKGGGRRPRVYIRVSTCFRQRLFKACALH